MLEKVLFKNYFQKMIQSNNQKLWLQNLLPKQLRLNVILVMTQITTKSCTEHKCQTNNEHI